MLEYVRLTEIFNVQLAYLWRGSNMSEVIGIYSYSGSNSIPHPLLPRSSISCRIEAQPAALVILPLKRMYLNPHSDAAVDTKIPPLVIPWQNILRSKAGKNDYYWQYVDIWFRDEEWGLPEAIVIIWVKHNVIGGFFEATTLLRKILRYRGEARQRLGLAMDIEHQYD
jgi:hypothetical protein